MTVEQMLSRDEIECVAAQSFGNKDFQVQQYRKRPGILGTVVQYFGRP